MNEIEERVYTLTDSANSLAAELYDALDMEFMKEINGLLRQALERANKVKANVGKG